jgi:hypothetical protein
MKRKRKSVGMVTFMIFVALVLISGYTLNAAGYDNNPFSQITFLTSSVGSGGGRFERNFTPETTGSDLALPALESDDSGIDLTGLSTSDSQLQLPPVDELSTSNTVAATSSGTDTIALPDRGGDQNSIAWSDIGDVLYNLWFICATTVVFIVVQYLFKFALNQFKRRMPRTPRMAAAK